MKLAIILWWKIQNNVIMNILNWLNQNDEIYYAFINIKNSKKFSD